MDKTDKNSAAYDIVLQVAMVLVMVFSYLFMHDVPKKLWAKLRLQNRADIQAKRHFVEGAQLLARAQSSKSRALAKEAQAQAQRAISLDPRDAAPYILKALALDLQGLRSAALDSLDESLSPLAAKSLSDSERGDALLKRAELRLGTSQRGRVDSALADLEESVKLSPGNAKAFFALGECYERKKMNDDALKAYQQALELEPQLPAAQQALNRLDSSPKNN
ncbi:superkiller protein 3 [Spatholobus suberectus]|nr:superkiller protein 3 [Spatholobus suberectus]